MERSSLFSACAGNVIEQPVCEYNCVFSPNYFPLLKNSYFSFFFSIWMACCFAWAVHFYLGWNYAVSCLEKKNLHLLSLVWPALFSDSCAKRNLYRPAPLFFSSFPCIYSTCARLRKKNKIDLFDYLSNLILYSVNVFFKRLLYCVKWIFHDEKNCRLNFYC